MPRASCLLVSPRFAQSSTPNLAVAGLSYLLIEVKVAAAMCLSVVNGYPLLREDVLHFKLANIHQRSLWRCRPDSLSLLGRTSFIVLLLWKRASRPNIPSKSRPSSSGTETLTFVEGGRDRARTYAY